MSDLSQATNKANEGTFSYREDVFHAARSEIQRSSIFIVDLSAEEAALEETTKPKTVFGRSYSTSSLPAYENLARFFIHDAPPTYTAATGRKLEFTELEVNV